MSNEDISRNVGAESEGVSRLIGTIARIVADRGYAFLTVENQPDFFLHMKQVSKFSVPFRNFKKDQKVAFTRFDSPTGPQAHDAILVVD